MNKFTLDYADKLSGRQFEFYCAKLMKLTSDMKDIQVTQATNDHGADVLSKENGLCVFQCKHLYKPTKERLGYRALEDTAAGKEYYHASHGILVTNSYVSKRLIKEAQHMNLGIVSRPNLNSIIAQSGAEYAVQHHLLIKFMNKQTAKLLKDINNQYRTFLNLKSFTHHDTLKMALKNYDRDLHLKNVILSNKSLALLEK